MDKEKLKKWAGYAGRYAGYAGLGLVGGFLGIVLVGISVGTAMGMAIEGWFVIPFLLIWFFFENQIYILIPILGGLLVGVITKKWWWALLAGFILFTLFTLCFFVIAIGHNGPTQYPY